MYGRSSIPLIILAAIATVNGAASLVFLALRARIPEPSAVFGAILLTFIWGLWLGLIGLYGTAVLRSDQSLRPRRRPLRLRRHRTASIR